MSHMFRSVLIAAFALTLLGSAGCSPKVEVRTGTRVLCTYGEVISDDVRTIKVSADDAGKYKVRTITQVCDRHAELDALYFDAQTAIAAGDFTTAEKKLQQVLKIEPTHSKAAAQVAAIAKGEKPAPDSSTPNSPAPPASEKPGEATTGIPAESLLKFAPDTLTGFLAGKPAVDPLTVARDYVPAEGSKVVTLVIAVEQFSSSKMANAALTTQVKNAYSKDKDSFKSGTHDVYYGTDGRLYGALGFVDGSVMVTVEMSGKPGKDPAALKSELRAVLAQLP